MALAAVLALGACAKPPPPALVVEACPAPPEALLEAASPAPQSTDLTLLGRARLSLARAQAYWSEVERRQALAAWGREHCGW